MRRAKFIRAQAVIPLLLVSLFLAVLPMHQDRAAIGRWLPENGSGVTRTDETFTITNLEPENAGKVPTADVVMKWNVSGEDNGSLNYTVYLGTDEFKVTGLDGGVRVSSDQSNTSYIHPIRLSDDTTYYWKITAQEGSNGNITESEVWSFTVNLKKGAPTEEDILPVILGAMLLLIVIILFVFLRYRRKSEEGALTLDLGSDETVEAEIVHVPETGKTGSTFKPQPKEERVAQQMVQPMAQPMAQRRFEERIMPMEERGPILESRRPTTSFLSLLKAMEMLRQQTAPPERNEELRELKVHLPGHDELDMRVRKKEEVLSLPAPSVLEVSEKQQKVPIDELFLINPGGLLVQHYSLDRETGLNEDVLAGMLTAVKSFISDSLSMLDKSADAESEINRIDFGKYSVLMASGRSLSLVAITDHEKKEEIMEQLNLCARVLEKRFGDIIHDWDGDTAKVEAIKPWIERMVKGEFDADDIQE